MIEITQIKKVQGELNISSLHLLCNALLVAKVDADKRIEFVPGIHLYPGVLRQVLDVAENFRMISSSLPDESQHANPNHPQLYAEMRKMPVGYQQPTAYQTLTGDFKPDAE